MKIIFDDENEILDIFLNSLCGVIYGNYMEGYGLEWVFDHMIYCKIKEDLRSKGKSICYEDVLIEMLKQGHSLTLRDVEGMGDKSEYTVSITKKDIIENFKYIPYEVLANFITEDDDIDDHDQVIQYCFYKDLIFG